MNRSSPWEVDWAGRSRGCSPVVVCYLEAFDPSSWRAPLVGVLCRRLEVGAGHVGWWVWMRWGLERTWSWGW